MMKMYWFKKLGWLYLPVHPLGYVVTLCAFLFMWPILLAVIRNGHSGTDDLYQLFAYGTCTAFWWKWIADKTSA